MELKVALEQLDPENAEHWTQDGAARLDVLKGLTGGPVSREDIAAVAPGFSRAKPDVNVVTDTPEPAVTTQFGNAPFQAVDPADANKDGDESDVVVGDGTGETLPEVEAPQVPENEAEVEAEYAKALANLQDAQKRFDAVSVLMDRILVKRDAEAKGENFAHTVQNYQKQAQLEREQEVKRQEAMKAMLANM